MKKLIFILNIIILLNAASIQSMEDHATRALRANRYNKKHPLFFTLQPEILDTILLCCHDDEEFGVRSLTNTIKNFMHISSVCKHFHALLTLKKFGQLCQTYPTDTKTMLLQDLIKKIALFEHKSLQSECMYNFPLAVIVHAQESTALKESTPLLVGEVVYKNDTDTLKKIANKINLRVNPSTYFYGKPLFFYSKTIDMAKIFINSQVDIHINDNKQKNVLWHVITNNYLAELLSFYVNYGVDTTQIDPVDGACLLHELVLSCASKKESIENYIMQGNILLNKISDMVNELNHAGQSPLYLAKKYKIPRMIRLLTIYGGRTIPAPVQYHPPTCVIS